MLWCPVYTETTHTLIVVEPDKKNTECYVTVPVWQQTALTTLANDNWLNRGVWARLGHLSSIAPEQ